MRSKRSLADNRSRRRRHEPGVRFLLQGLTVCSKCGYAYVGKMQNKSKYNDEARSYGYYFCTGTDRFRWGGVRICPNRPVRMERLDATVWDDVSSLLSDPARIQEEYERQKNQAPAQEPRRLKEIAQEILKLRRGISRMLDLYQDGDLDKAEFEPRHRRARQRLSELEAEASSLAEEALPGGRARGDSERLQTVCGACKARIGFRRLGGSSGDYQNADQTGRNQRGGGSHRVSDRGTADGEHHEARHSPRLFATWSLQPVAIGAAVEVTKPSEPSRQTGRFGDSASRQAVIASER